MGGFIITLSLFITFIFPILISLFGLSYFGSESSPIYILTVVIVNALTIIYIIFYEIRHKGKGRGCVLYYFLPLIFVLLYLFEYSIGWICQSDSSFLIFRNAMAISMVGIVVGVFAARYDKFEDIYKNIELLMLLCTISMILALPSMYSSGYGSSIGGGGGHQTISYTAAFAFGINFCRIKCNQKFGYKFFCESYYKYIAYVLMFFQIIICLIGGGRGGVVLLIVLALFSLLYYRGNILKLVIALFAFFLILNVASSISLFGVGDMLSKGAERAFAFIGDSSIDLAEGSSGRDYVYERAIALISDSPLFGYGFFRQYDLCQEYFQQPYSHNLFLELMLQGGVLLVIVFAPILIKFVCCLHRLVVSDNKYFPLISITLFPLVMLMFSGSYFSTPLFWFVIIYVLMEYRYNRVSTH